jgi:hypothetical protein
MNVTPLRSTTTPPLRSSAARASVTDSCRRVAASWSPRTHTTVHDGLGKRRRLRTCREVDSWEGTGSPGVVRCEQRATRVRSTAPEPAPCRFNTHGTCSRVVPYRTPCAPTYIGPIWGSQSGAGVELRDVRTSGRRHRRGRPGCRRMSRAAGRATCRAGVSRPVNARSAMTRTWPVPAAVRQRIVRELGDSMISRSSTSSSQCFEESSGVASTITSPRHRQAQCFDFGISEHRLPPLHRRPTTGYETGLVTAHERNPKADTNIS